MGGPCVSRHNKMSHNGLQNVIGSRYWYTYVYKVFVNATFVAVLFIALKQELLVDDSYAVSQQNCCGMDNERLEPYDIAVHEATKRGDHRVLRELLRAGACGGSADFDGWIPLMFAAEGGHAECVRLLLESGADPDWDGAYNEPSTASQLAVCNGNEACVLLLLKAEAEADEPLKMAVRNNFVQCVKFLLKEGASTEELVRIRKYVRSNEMWKAVGAAGVDVFYPERMDRVSSLMSICRRAIRCRLVRVGDSQNLFHKVPLLRLPSLVQEYLLYSAELE